MSLLKVSNLNVNLPAGFKLIDINFEIADGETLLLTGPSGCGKTLLLETLAGKHFIKSGDVSGVQKEQIVLVTQEHRFKTKTNTSEFYYQQRFNSLFSLDSATVLEEIQAIAGENNDRIEEVLNCLELQHLRDQHLIKLSNGENKRLQIAKALVKYPQLILLDQPFVGLDYNSRKILQNVFEDLNKKNVSLIIATNNFEYFSKEIQVLKLEFGKIVFKDLLKNYHYKIVDSNLNLKNIIDYSKEIIVDLQNVTLSYGSKKILDNFSWTIRKGEKWLLSGPNGSGKTSILSLINADNPQAYANQVYLFGRRRGSGESIWDIKKQIGFFSPELHLYFDLELTCEQVLLSGFFNTICKPKSYTKAQLEVVDYYLNLLNLDHRRSSKLYSFSQTQQRLILVARALIKNPKLLILDEPAQGLDAEQILKLKSIINQTQDPEQTLIYVSHNNQDVPEIITLQLNLQLRE